MKKIHIDENLSLEEVVYHLLNYKVHGEEVYCIYHDVKLYSNDITIDNAYLKVYGCTKQEFDSLNQNNNFSKDKMYPNYEEVFKIKGKNVVFFPCYAIWSKFVDDYLNFNQADTIAFALELMELLKFNAPIEYVAERYFNHKPQHFLEDIIIRNIIYTCSFRGPDFWMATCKYQMSDEEKEIVDAKKQENIKLDKYFNSKNVSKR